MNNNCKVQIYKGMIQYLLDSTSYTLKNIAEFSRTSITNIRTIYYEDNLPLDFSSELLLLNLYQIILEINQSKNIGKNKRPHNSSME